MQRLELRRKISDRLGFTGQGDALITPAVLNGLIDDALSAYAREKINWPWLLTETTLTLTTGEADLPARFLRARALLVTNGGVLTPVVQARLDEFNTPLAMTHRWTLFGTTVRVLPVPTAALSATFRYYASEAPLANDNDEPALPEAYQQLLIDHATSQAFALRQDDRRADRYMTLYQQGVRDAGQAIRQSAQPRGVRVRDEDEWFTYGTWT